MFMRNRVHQGLSAALDILVQTVTVISVSAHDFKRPYLNDDLAVELDTWRAASLLSTLLLSCCWSFGYT